MAYYLTKQFQQNQIFDLLAGEAFTRVVSLDMGRGWTRARLYEKGEDNWTETALKLDDKGNTRIPTRISYDQSGDPPVEIELVGYEADPMDFRQQFKTPPQNWDKTSPDGVHTFKTLMGDFIGSLWFISMRDNNPDLELEEEDWDQALLVVGCPFSNNWIGTDDYRQMVKEVTVHDHVVVLPESGAAMMWAAHQGQLELSGGVALFDLGAVTTDFLYVQQGKKLSARSLEWGGNRVDRALLDEILNANGMKRQDIPLNQLANVLNQVREMKEAFDPAQSPSERTLTIPNTEAGKPDREISVTVDGDLMARAISPLLPELEDFFQQMKGRIGSRPCGTVLLTGGASLTPQVLELAKQVFGCACQVQRLENPADCVVQGLALTMCGRLRVMALAKQQRSVIEDYLAARYDGFLLHCRDVVLGSFFSIAPRQLHRVKETGKNLRLSQIVALIEKAVRATGLPETQKLSWHMKDVSHESIQALSVGVPNLMEYIYAAPNQTDTQALLADTEQALETRRNKVNLNALMAQILDQTSFTKLFFFSYIDDDILKRYNSLLYRGARGAAAAVMSLFPNQPENETDNPELWRSSGAFKYYPELLDEQTLADRLLLLVHEDYNRAQYYINLEKKDPLVDKKTLDEILKKADTKHGTSDWHQRHMNFTLAKCPMLQQIYDQLFRDLYEVVLGKVLLLVFDERADIP